jgi:hypothetical protein
MVESSIKCISARCVQRPSREVTGWAEPLNAVSIRTCANDAHLGHTVNTLALSGYTRIMVAVLPQGEPEIVSSATGDEGHA